MIYSERCRQSGVRIGAMTALVGLSSQLAWGRRRLTFPVAPGLRKRHCSKLMKFQVQACGELIPCSKRRSIVILTAGAATTLSLLFGLDSALAVKQILLAGRVPGLSAPDDNGFRTYRRPDAKSGGHGVGWSPIIPYSFKVPDEWEEVPVSIADLGGTEIDLRFSSKQEGNLSVVVAPILRFASDLGDNATIEKVGPPEKVIDAFGPELVGQNVEGQVKDMEVREHDGRTYYFYELNIPHVLITATAAGNRLYLMTVSGNARQWKKHGDELKDIAGSFRVD